MKRWNEIFAELFDPKVPLLFLVGSLSLTVAGSALYTIVSNVAGTGYAPQGLLLLVSLVIGLFAITFLRQLIQRWAVRRSQETVVLAGAVVTPHPFLILLVGTNRLGAEEDIIRHHAQQRLLKECWLISSTKPESVERARALRDLLAELNVTPHLEDQVDAFAFKAVYEASLRAIRAALRAADGRPVIVDITPGTAVMSAGLTLAARELSVSIEYAQAIRDGNGQVLPGVRAIPQLVATVETAAEVPQ